MGISEIVVRQRFGYVKCELPCTIVIACRSVERHYDLLPGQTLGRAVDLPIPTSIRLRYKGPANSNLQKHDFVV